MCLRNKKVCKQEKKKTKTKKTVTNDTPTNSDDSSNTITSDTMSENSHNSCLITRPLLKKVGAQALHRQRRPILSRHTRH